MPYRQAKSDIIFNYTLFLAFITALIAGLALVVFMVIPTAIKAPTTTDAAVYKSSSIQGGN